MTKLKGIDERKIRCCDDSKLTIEAGISFDKLENGQNILCFHFLESMPNKEFIQTTKSMWLDKKNIKELIKELKELL